MYQEGHESVCWGMAQVMAARKSRGQLLVQLRGHGRWYPVEAVTIERPRQCPTGACDLGEETADQETKRAELMKALEYEWNEKQR